MLRVDTNRRDGFPLGDEAWDGHAAARALSTAGGASPARRFDVRLASRGRRPGGPAPAARAPDAGRRRAHVRARARRRDRRGHRRRRPSDNGGPRARWRQDRRDREPGRARGVRQRPAGPHRLSRPAPHASARPSRRRPPRRGLRILPHAARARRCRRLSHGHRRRQSRRAAVAVRAAVARRSAFRSSWRTGDAGDSVRPGVNTSRAARHRDPHGIRRAHAGHRVVSRAQRAAIPVHAALDRRRSALRPANAWTPASGFSRRDRRRPRDRLCGNVGSARIQAGDRARLFAASGQVAERGEPGRAAGRRARAAAGRTPARVRLPVPRGGRRRSARRDRGARFRKPAGGCRPA